MTYLEPTLARSSEQNPQALESSNPTDRSRKRTLREVLLSKGKKATTAPTERVFPSLFIADNPTPTNSTDPGLAGANALILQAVSQPPILAASAHEESEGQIRQRSTSLFKRLQWTLVQKKIFYEAINELKASNDTLRDLIKIKSLADPGFLLHARSQKQDNGQLKSTQVLLGRLHKAIRSVNQEPRPDCLQLDVRLVERHESTRQLRDDQGIDFRPGTCVIQLQAQKPSEGIQSYFLLVDAFLEEKGECIEHAQLMNDGGPITSLKDAIALDGNSCCTKFFKLLGHIPS